MSSDRATDWLAFPDWGSHGEGGGWHGDAFRRDLTEYRQDTGAVRVINANVDAADVVRLEDEMCLASQDRITDGSEFDVINADPAGLFIRHIVQPFTVGRAALVAGAEVQLRTQPFGFLADSGSAWLAIYSATNADFTPAGSRLLVGVIGKIHNHRISYLYWQNFFVPVARGEIALVAGTNYFLCLCADDPEGIGPDQWIGTTDNVDVEAQCYLGGDGMYVPAAVIDFPDLAAAYFLNARSIWFRLYEHRYMLDDVPLVTPGSLTTAGDLATATRIGGIHGHYEIDGPMSGQTAAGRTLATAGVGGGGAGGAITYDPNAVIYADAAGVLTGVAADFFWDDINHRLGILTATPGAIGQARLEIVGPDVSTDGPNIQLLTDVDGFPIFATYIRTHDYAAFMWDAYLLGAGYRSSDAGSNYLFPFKIGDEMRTYYSSANAQGAVIAWTQGPTLNASGQWLVTLGSAALPSLAFLTRTTDGIFSAAAGSIGFASGGVAQWIMSATALYPFADNAEDVGTSALGVKALYFSDANAAYPATNGEVRCSANYGEMLAQFGADQTGHIADVIRDEQALPATVNTTAGDLAETSIYTDTLDAAFCVEHNVAKIYAAGTAFIRPTTVGGDANYRIELRIEGTDVVGWDQGVAQSVTDEDYVAWSAEAVLSFNAGGDIEVTQPRLIVKAYNRGGDPFPWEMDVDADDDHDAAVYVGGWNAALARAGDVAIAIRGFIDNAIPTDVSYIRVRQFHIGRNQV